MACATQTLLDFDLVIDPPATVIAFRDYYGNAVHDFGVPYLHEQPLDRGDERVVTHAGEDEQLAGPGDGEPDARRRSRRCADDAALGDECAEFLGAERVHRARRRLGGARARAARRGDPRRTALGFLYRRARSHVRRRLDYRVGTTTVNSSVAEVLEGGGGVCQDFAHVLISLCRHAGLPARYVSGYLGSVAEADRLARLGRGLRAALRLGRHRRDARPHCTGAHVKVGVGRDYADVAVLRGTYQGGGPRRRSRCR